MKDGKMASLEFAILDDEFLVRQATKGDRGAMAALLERHAEIAVTFAYAEIGNRADALDVAQVALMRIAKDLISNWPDQPFKTCLYVRVHHAAIDLLRRNSSHRRHEQAAWTSYGPKEMVMPFDEAAHQETITALREELVLLPDELATVLTLHYLDGLTLAQVAAQTRLGLSACKMRLSRGRKLLGERLVRRGVALASVAIVSTMLNQLFGTAKVFAAGLDPAVFTQLAATALVHVPAVDVTGTTSNSTVFGACSRAQDGTTSSCFATLQNADVNRKGAENMSRAMLLGSTIFLMLASAQWLSFPAVAKSVAINASMQPALHAGITADNQGYSAAATSEGSESAQQQESQGPKCGEPVAGRGADLKGTAVNPGVVKDVTQGSLRLAQKDGSIIECPLKHTDVQVEISGFIASVKVTQTFSNPLPEKIEAVYVFPLPHESAVDGMTMVIGERRIVGLMTRRAEARQVYESALKQGRTAALLEQERPNIFTQSVGNIGPNQEVKVEITYVDVLKYDCGSYEFHFPMVVGPRYIPDTDAVPDASRITPPLLNPAQRNGHDIAVSVLLDAGVPIQNPASGNHRVAVTRQENQKARIVLESDDSIPNKDFVLRYGVTGPKPAMALLTHSDGSLGHFMLMVQPMENEQLQKSPPREIVFMIDVSGSMGGAPTEKCKEVMSHLLKLCNKEDTLQVITFASDTYKLFEKPLQVNETNSTRALNFTQGLQGGGGTEMLKGIRMAIDDPLDAQRVRVVIMLTDGYIGNEAQIIEAVGKGCNDQIRFWCVGIGSSPNRFLVDGVARQGGGMGKVLGLNDDSKALSEEMMERIHRAQLSKVKINWGGMNVCETFPVKIPELWSGHPIVIYGQYSINAENSRTRLAINGNVEGEPVSWPLDVDFAADATYHAAIEKVWARQKIEDLMQQTFYKGSPAIEEEVTSIALQYSLMTQYTSFVAVDEIEAKNVTRTAKMPRRMLVPVPIPDGTQYSGFFEEESDKTTVTAMSGIMQEIYYRHLPLSKSETEHTDPTSKETSDIIVPPGILAMAELGDHFETINSKNGSDDLPGGGGTEGENLDELIGVGGQPSSGTGGGWGGGTDTGIGVGSGHGSFGNRMEGGRKLLVKRYGGSKATESSVDLALSWLAQHQKPDGHFDSQKNNAMEPGSDTIATSFALLAWLGAGHTEKVGLYKEHVQRALAWLIQRQAADGSFPNESGVAKGTETIPVQAIATLALSEAAGMAQIIKTQSAAQSAIDCCIKNQIGTGEDKGGWRLKPNESADLCSTVWFVMALKSAKVAGFKVDTLAIEDVLKFLDTLEHKLEPDTGKGGEPAAIYWRSKTDEDPAQAHVLTAMGTLARQLLGTKAENLRASVEWFMAKGGLPAWDKADPTYWYFGTLCAFHQGGDVWMQWKAALKNTLVANQNKTGDDTGSWNMPWGAAGGSLYLETYYKNSQMGQ